MLRLRTPYLLAPVALGVASERAGKLGIAFTVPDGAIDEIDAASQIRDPAIRASP